MFGLIWWLISVFMTVRFYQMAKIACRLLRLHVIYPKLGWTFNLDPYKNSWAVVTGGTDGIGKAYLNEIAAKGFTKFALIGRNKKKLDGIQRFLTTKYKAEVQVLVFDFASTEYGPLEDFIKGLGEIGALFNFVGTMPSSSGKFCDSLPGVASKVFAVNAVSAVKLTDLILPGMVQRDKGLVVHCSSIAGHRPMHRCSSYSASKAALSFLGATSAMEHQTNTLRLQVLTPLFVATKMINSPAASLLVISPEDYAREAVSTLGLHSYNGGCVAHELQFIAGLVLPFWLVKHAFGPINDFITKQWRLDERKME